MLREQTVCILREEEFQRTLIINYINCLLMNADAEVWWSRAEWTSVFKHWTLYIIMKPKRTEQKHLLLRNELKPFLNQIQLNNWDSSFEKKSCQSMKLETKSR